MKSFVSLSDFGFRIHSLCSSGRTASFSPPLQLTADNLEMTGCIGFGSPFEIRHRGFHTPGPMRHSGSGHPHLHAGQSSHEGQLVALAEVADAAHIANDCAKSGHERHNVF